MYYIINIIHDKYKRNQVFNFLLFLQNKSKKH